MVILEVSHGGNNVGGIVLKIGGFQICFDEVQGSLILFKIFKGFFQIFLVNLNLLSHFVYII
jgi:hypothetical protein